MQKSPETFTELDHDEVQRKRDIAEIEHFKFKGAWKRIGADCSGDSRGACARSNSGKCGVYHNCEAASAAMGPEEICPAHTSEEDAHKEAEAIYEKVSQLAKFHDISDKSFELKHEIIATNGDKVQPKYILDKTDERSTEDLAWYDPEDIKTSLILKTNFQKDSDREGNDNSSFELPPSPTPEQLGILKEFCEIHGLFRSEQQ
ncbi:MAG: hypothetical protein Q7S37_04740 [bacterium]|nr:hypothetical protein [bacterium]